MASGTVEACHTAPYYMLAKDPTFAFGCAVPFGLNGRMQNSWWLEGGGEALMNAFYAKYNIYGLLAGNTMAPDGRLVPQGDQHHRRPEGRQDADRRICRQRDLQAGRRPQQLAGGDIYPALEKGTIDAAEWVGPHDDEKLGLHKVAKFYYYPGWWEGGAMIHVQVNKEKWEALPKNYKAILQGGRSSGPQLHGRPLRRAEPGGGEEDPRERHAAAGHSPRRIMDACFKAANEVYAEISAKNEDFKKLWEFDQGVPRRPVPVAAAGRQRLRQLHADPAPQEDAVTGRAVA